jgi:xylan 1,4-beta-xylosidase
MPETNVKIRNPILRGFNPDPSILRVGDDDERLYFAFRVNGKEWKWLPGQFDSSILSDEASPPGNPNFTGAFVGMCCQDLAGTCHAADFDYFFYRERCYCADIKAAAHCPSEC